MEFLTEQEFNDLSYETVNEVLTRVYNKAIEDTLAALPNYILKILENTARFNKIKAEFLERHKDALKDKEKFIQALDIAEMAMPGASYEDILDKALELTNTKLSLPESVPINPDEAMNGVL